MTAVVLELTIPARRHLCLVCVQIMAEPSPEAPPSPAEPTNSLSCGLDRLMLDVDGEKKEPNGLIIGTQPLATGTATQSTLTRAQVSSAPTTTSRPPASQGTAALEAAAAAAVAATTPRISVPEESKPRGTLVVSPPPPAGTSASSRPVAPVPVVTLSSKSPLPLTRKSGPKKMGARKLGAMKLSGGGAVKLSGFKDAPAASLSVAGAGTDSKSAVEEDADLMLARKLQKEEDAAAVAAPSARLAAAATAAISTPALSKANDTSSASSGSSIYRSVNDSAGAYGYHNGGNYGSASVGSGVSSTYSYGGGSSSTFDKEKYKNVKGIGSDMLFGEQDDDPTEQTRRMLKAEEYGNSSAISSDMYFDREEPGNADGSGSGVGLGDMAEQIAMTAATELQSVSQAASNFKVCAVLRAWSNSGVNASCVFLVFFRSTRSF